MSADERRSIISLTDSSGALIGINRYDEYGKPQSTNLGRYQYTGQMWLSEIGAYHYKARAYLPHLGIFAQTDPTGYADGMNLYAYVGNDPVNLVDPWGMTAVNCVTGICVTGTRSSNGPALPDLTGAMPGMWVAVGATLIDYTDPVAGEAAAETSDDEEEIVVTGTRKRPKYCSSKLYKFADKADRLAGYGQYVAIVGVGLGASEFDPLQRAALTRGAWFVYDKLGIVRALATGAKVVAGDRMSLADFAGTIIGKYAGVDKIGDAFGGVGLDLANSLVRPDPCKATE